MKKNKVVKSKFREGFSELKTWRNWGREPSKGNSAFEAKARTQIAGKFRMIPNVETEGWDINSVYCGAERVGLILYKPNNMLSHFLLFLTETTQAAEHFLFPSG